MERPTVRGKRRTPIWLVSAAFLICLISSLIAFNQDPHPNAFRSNIPFPQNLADSDWWRYPREANTFKRLPVIPSPLNDLYAAPDGLRLWAVGDSGLMAHSRDGGKTWEQQNAEVEKISSQDSLASLPQHKTLAYRESVPVRGWISSAFAGGVGASDSTGGGMTTPTTVPSIVQKRIKATRENDQIPETVNSNQVNLNGIVCMGDLTCWAVGEDGTILATTDGGQTWQSPVHYRQSPAPWYWLIGWGIPLLLLVVALRMVPGDRTLDESVSGALVSDRPLEAGDPDPLKFSTISNGLSRFLRHDKTQPPLTIAITGDWGTGKSSLMNLLKADLARYGFRPVWFNAWHHQKEEHLLAALLEAIRSSSVPPWWHPANWRFRSRLLALRLKKHLISFLAFGAL